MTQACGVARCVSDPTGLAEALNDPAITTITVVTHRRRTLSPLGCYLTIHSTRAPSTLFPIPCLPLPLLSSSPPSFLTLSRLCSMHAYILIPRTVPPNCCIISLTFLPIFVCLPVSPSLPTYQRRHLLSAVSEKGPLLRIALPRCCPCSGSGMSIRIPHIQPHTAIGYPCLPRLDAPVALPFPSLPGSSVVYI